MLRQPSDRPTGIARHLRTLKTVTRQRFSARAHAPCARPTPRDRPPGVIRANPCYTPHLQNQSFSTIQRRSHTSRMPTHKPCCLAGTTSFFLHCNALTRSRGSLFTSTSSIHVQITTLVPPPPPPRCPGRACTAVSSTVIGNGSTGGAPELCSLAAIFTRVPMLIIPCPNSPVRKL